MTDSGTEEYGVHTQIGLLIQILRATRKYVNHLHQGNNNLCDFFQFQNDLFDLNKSTKEMDTSPFIDSFTGERLPTRTMQHDIWGLNRRTKEIGAWDFVDRFKMQGNAPARTMENEYLIPTAPLCETTNDGRENSVVKMLKKNSETNDVLLGHFNGFGE